MPPARRSDRRVPEPSASPPRTPGQHDRDRVLHTYALRRLAGVTQVVGAHEGQLFHNRLTHTLEVAQIARRLAERLSVLQPRLALAHGGVDPEVCEAAALTHDLGHPPFGHIAEAELDRLGRQHRLRDGFEGNAQSFRIVNRLAAHRPGYRGLNLSRATLNAILKYPWLRDTTRRGSHRWRKFGAYDDDHGALRFARIGARGSERSAEASVMNHADDVAYSVHDFDDFLRAGIIRLDTLVHNDAQFDAFLRRWATRRPTLKPVIDRHREGLRAFLDTLFRDERYTGTFRQRAHQRALTAHLIDTFVQAATLTSPGSGEAIDVSPGRMIEMEFLKRLVFEFVIESPALGTQQEGQRAVIRGLFGIYLDGIRRRDEAVVPALFHTELGDLGRASRQRRPARAEVRLAMDIVASFTEAQALGMFKRLIGVEVGSVSDLVTL